MRQKNPYGKTRPADKPYEIWASPDGSWRWEILRKYQLDDEKQYARAFGRVRSPYVPHGELGDFYLAVLTEAHAVKVYEDPEIAKAKAAGK